jgi:hypothetical protein
MINKILNYELFSNWLFFWFLFYYFGITTSSPLIFLLIGIIITYFGIIFLGKINNSIIKLIKINFIIKVIPIFLIFKTPIFNEEDLLFGFFLFYIYIITLLYNNKNPIDIYIKLNLKTFSNKYE